MRSRSAIESVNLTESSLHGSILQTPTQIPQKICYNFALSALQTQGAATISPHIAHPLCFNEYRSESRHALLQKPTVQAALLFHAPHRVSAKPTRIPQKQPATL